MNEQNKNSIDNLSINIKKLISIISSNNEDFPWTRIRKLEQKNGQISPLQSLFESLFSTSYRICQLSNKEQLDLYEITWIANKMKEIIEMINNFFQRYSIEVLSHFISETQISDYEQFYKCDWTVIEEISNKRDNIKSKTNKKHFYNFIVSLRNFLIHTNSLEYNFIMFDDCKEISNIIKFKNRWNNKFKIEINYLLFINYLNDFIVFIYKNKEVYLKTIKKHLKEKTNFKIDIDYIWDKRNNLRKINIENIEEIIHQYGVDKYIKAFREDEKYKQLIFKLIKKSNYDYKRNFFDIEFNNLINNFDIEFTKILGLPKYDGYIISQIECDDEFLKTKIDEKKYQEIMSNNRNRKLYENIYRIAIEKIIKKHKDFMSKIETFL